MEGRKTEGWANIRDFFVEQACKYQTSVKLWDAQRPGGPLHQIYPEFLSRDECRISMRKLKCEIPNSENQAKNQLRKLIKSCKKTTGKLEDANNNSFSSGDLIKVSKGVNRILNLCSNFIPNEAHNDTDVHNLIRFVPSLESVLNKLMRKF